ncbi:hypothetical protein Lalb_Chr18g0054551 [Lupinus albus]|uniref:Uncharacterized protein n=1 Tax=Lupinus albus TaxID=3870 RepID=A0A6A4NZC9_LUPAL|nr:hypothetical protein Lalb_Chr18g0054551 [Lupinus albus]
MLSTVFLSLGYKQSYHDCSLFTKQSNHKFTSLLVVCVDDLVLALNAPSEIHFSSTIWTTNLRSRTLVYSNTFLDLK